MVVTTNVKIELSLDEHHTLLNAQKLWQEIYEKFDENGVDVGYITYALDDGLCDLLNACEKGVGLEE